MAHGWRKETNQNGLCFQNHSDSRSSMKCVHRLGVLLPRGRVVIIIFIFFNYMYRISSTALTAVVDDFASVEMVL